MCILPHFAAKTPNFAVFCGSLFRSKAVPLHRISKRAEIANRRTSAANHPLTVRTLPAPPLRGEYGSLPLRGGGQRGLRLEGLVSLRISDHKITIRDTVFITRTDTLLRTQTITQTERYIHSFDRFCTITLATLATFATLAFSIRLRS